MEGLYKYSRTPHLPISPGGTDDDKRLKDYSNFIGNDIVITEKMDGENSNLYPNYFHARSKDSNNHPSRNWIKGLHGSIKHLIPEGWRICMENCYAEHSLKYENLETYAYVLNIWNENNECLSFDETLEYCELLGLTHAPILYRGNFDYDKLVDVINNLDLNKQEGLVIRNTKLFHYNDFSKNYGKWVRERHVQTDEHWMSKKVVPNKLKSHE